MQSQTNFSSYSGTESQTIGRYTGMPYRLYTTQEEIEKPYLITAAIADRIIKTIAFVSLFSALFLFSLNA